MEYYSVNGAHHLTLGGMDAVALAEKYGTPLYVMEEDVVRAAMRAYRQSMERFYGGNGLVCYASKAFCCKEIYRIAAAEGLGADVVSGGEIYTAAKAGFPMAKAVFHGNNKTREELRMALALGVGRIVVDNFEELKTLAALASENGVRPDILLRVTPGIEAHTHKFIMTGQNDSKFGFILETGEAMEAARQAIGTLAVRLTGVHVHIGSQIHEAAPFIQAAERMVRFMADVRAETGYTLTDLNLGGGFGIRYTGEDDPVPYAAYMRDVSGAVRQACGQLNFPVPFILMEPGRSIAGEAGTTLYTVGSVKKIPGIRTYVSVDGGMGDNPRYILYGSKYEFLLANRADEAPAGEVTVAGKCCESGDLLGENVPLPEAKPGDILAVRCTGAYNYSMASCYNRNPIPPVVMVRDGEDRVIVKGMTYEQIVENDI